MENCSIPLDPVLATKPAITFIPELAKRAALARLANVREMTLTALLNWMISRNDEITQRILAHVDQHDVAAYLDGRNTK
jgi:hypothetical protein